MHSKTNPKPRLLNTRLAAAIADLRHGETIFVADAGMERDSLLPLPAAVEIIDVGVVTGCPSLRDLLPVMCAYGDFEAAIVTREMRDANPGARALVDEVVGADRVHEIAYYPEEIADLKDRHMHPLRGRDLYALRDRSKVFVQTGEFRPHGNVVLVGGYTSPDIPLDWLLSDRFKHEWRESTAVR